MSLTIPHVLGCETCFLTWDDEFGIATGLFELFLE